MKRFTTVVPVLLALFALGAPLRAQDDYTFTAGILGGIGGSLDNSRSQSFDQRSYEVFFGALTNERTFAMVRYGSLRFDRNEDVGGLLDAKLRYLTVAGEYRFAQPTYDFGIYLGLGGYELSGRPPGLGRSIDQSLGLAFGLTGDFDLTRHFSLVGEFSAHYAFLDRADLYGLALGGVAVHF